MAGCCSAHGGGPSGNGGCVAVGQQPPWPNKPFVQPLGLRGSWISARRHGHHDIAQPKDTISHGMKDGLKLRKDVVSRAFCLQFKRTGESCAHVRDIGVYCVMQRKSVIPGSPLIVGSIDCQISSAMLLES